MNLGMAADLERVRLFVDRIGAVEAVVARLVPGAAELVFTSAPPAPARLMHRRTGRTEGVGDDPPAITTGTILAVAGPSGQVREDIVHFLFTDVVDAALAAVTGATTA
jgi:hypothetical protein